MSRNESTIGDETAKAYRGLLADNQAIIDRCVEEEHPISIRIAEKTQQRDALKAGNVCLEKEKIQLEKDLPAASLISDGAGRKIENRIEKINEQLTENNREIKKCQEVIAFGGQRLNQICFPKNLAIDNAVELNFRLDFAFKFNEQMHSAAHFYDQFLTGIVETRNRLTNKSWGVQALNAIIATVPNELFVLAGEPSDFADGQPPRPLKVEKFWVKK